ncbi:MAG TPA: bifunctional serine/threonine-protein kinase/formylglycine-generating enzyme family protein [Polyangiaceae bacterium]|jgi:formylglycine-generating enzyme required for sulfatase activity/serine/threonine protein kinase|nr:bifunctional serine/threonine-protein kinase/formylglycine-generating enzyme family protein [Polyangiaceae bacterium]
MDRFPSGTVFGNDFKVVRLLREGGMGAVFVVEQMSTGRLRALKVLSNELGSDAGARERFVRESRIGAQIDSDHVVEVVTAGVDAGTGCPYLVMELLVGLDLDDVAEQYGPLPLGDTAEILAQFGHAIERAHALSIVHRDIKPANIFLAAPRRRGAPFTVKVLDFGIAKAVADNKLTGAAPLGTPLYMAPEQMEHAGNVTPAADVWALGLVVFRLLTGFDLWRASGESFPALVREIVIDPLPPATQRAAELTAAVRLPYGFDDWFARCVARDPAARYPEAGAAIAAFHDLVPDGTPTGQIADWLHAKMGVEGTSGQPMSGGSMRGHSGAGKWSSQKGSTPASVSRTAPTDSPPGADTGPRLPHITASAARSAPPAGDARTQYSSPLGETSSAKPVAAALPARTPSRAPLFVAAGLGVVALAGGAFFARGSSQRSAATQAPTPVVSAVAPVAAPPPRCPADMVLIQGGSMFMGDLDLENARPPHKVTVATFCVDKHEVTAAAYDACAGHGNCLKAPQDVHFADVTDSQRTAFSELCNARREGRGEHPANCVDWSMADNFCRAPGGRLSDGGAHLPTEAEWEYAARGSAQKAYPWGDEPPDATRLNACGRECDAWFKEHKLMTRTLYPTDDHFAGTAPIGSFPAGATREGVLDLAGNVWEWTGDWYGPYGAEPTSNPKGAEAGKERVVRGGSFNGSMSQWAKPAYRWKTTPDTYNHAIGFRCAMDAT